MLLYLFHQTTVEVERLNVLKTTKMKELVFKRQNELEEIYRGVHMDVDSDAACQILASLIDSGSPDSPCVFIFLDSLEIALIPLICVVDVRHIALSVPGFLTYSPSLHIILHLSTMLAFSFRLMLSSSEINVFSVDIFLTKLIYLLLCAFPLD